MALVVKYALSSVASLWRPTTDVLTLDEAVGYKIYWPMDKVILDRDPNFFEDICMLKIQILFSSYNNCVISNHHLLIF